MRIRDLGSERFTWTDLKAIIIWSGRDSALRRAMNPDRWQWDLQNELLARVGDAANWLVWANSDQAAKGKPPKPLPRPSNNWNKVADPDAVAVDVDELERLLSLPRTDI